MRGQFPPISRPLRFVVSQAGTAGRVWGVVSGESSAGSRQRGVVSGESSAGSRQRGAHRRGRGIIGTGQVQTMQSLAGAEGRGQGKREDASPCIYSQGGGMQFATLTPSAPLCAKRSSLALRRLAGVLVCNRLLVPRRRTHPMLPRPPAFRQ